MLATFVIGLREGLEAALIVGIIAAFLRRNGKSVAPMWWGVLAAVLLSAAVGVALKIVESNLDQATQEGMETVIGAVAVFFVTSMILWMSKNARGLKRELEGAAQDALADGTSRALVVMAFLAVLKEGFETAVFLLATFQAAGNVATAATGAVLGVLVAIGLGYGLYRGGVKINLSKFFKATGIFLVLVAAGLVVNALRTAHEAGWLNAGQQKTFDLSWLAPNGSVRGALLTGVLGIPAQPRIIEVIGWFAYVIPLCLYLYLPARLRPAPAAARRLLLGGAAASTVAAAALFFAVPKPSLDLPVKAPLTPSGTVSLSGHTLHTPSGDVVMSSAGQTQFHGETVDQLNGKPVSTSSKRPSSLTAAQLMALNGGRMPVGVDARVAPGPYTASWGGGQNVTASAKDGVLLDASSTSHDVVTLRDGGLKSPRTLTITDASSVGASSSWRVADSYVQDAGRKIAGLDGRRADADLWRHVIPTLLLLTAAALLLIALRRRSDEGASIGATAAPQRPTPPTVSTVPESASTPEPSTTPGGSTASAQTRKTIHANH